MDGSPPRRFWRNYREVHAQERAEREARSLERPESTARTRFWATLYLAWTLTLVDAVLDPGGVASQGLRFAWQGLRFVVGVVWLGFALWFLSEVLSRRRARKARG